MPRTASPTVAGLLQQLRKPGNQGGWAATQCRAEGGEPCVDHPEIDVDRVPHDCLFLAQQDFEATGRTARGMKLRAGVPEWEAPAEFWRMILFP